MNVRQLMALLSAEDPTAEVIVDPFVDMKGVQTGPIQPIAELGRGAFPTKNDAVKVPGSHPESDAWVAIITTDVWGQAPKVIPPFRTQAEWESHRSQASTIFGARGTHDGFLLSIKAAVAYAGSLFMAGDDAGARAIRTFANALEQERIKCAKTEEDARTQFGWP